jgi:hypothetical protein
MSKEKNPKLPRGFAFTYHLSLITHYSHFSNQARPHNRGVLTVPG